MAGKGTTGLAVPARRYDPLRWKGFETYAEAAIEDRIRAGMLRKRARREPQWAEEMLALADAIDPDVTRIATSAASKRFMRRYRRRLVGALWQLYDQHSLIGPARVDLLATRTTYLSEEFPNLDPRKQLDARRQDFLRAGASPATGWLFAAIHGEQDEETKQIHLHEHCLAVGSFVDAAERLRAQRKFAAPRAVMVTRGPLTALPRPFSYMRQSWFPRRDRRLEQPPRHRMTEPAHSLMLLWFDRHPPSAFELMMGLRVISGRLVSR